MSAVLDGRAAAASDLQMGIEGLAPVIEPLTNLVVAGRLARRPMLHVSTDGRPHFTIEIRQARNALPFVACYHGAVEEHAGLAELAMCWQPGTPVLVRGAGLALELFHEHEVLMLAECRAQPRELRFDDPQEAALV